MLEDASLAATVPSWDLHLSGSSKRKPQKRGTGAYPVAYAHLGPLRSGFRAPGQISNINLPTGVSGGQQRLQ